MSHISLKKYLQTTHADHLSALNVIQRFRDFLSGSYLRYKIGALARH